MDSRIVDKGNFRGGYFINNENLSMGEYLPGKDFVVTHKNSTALLKAILSIISNAQHYIKVCSFIVDNQDVVQALKSKMKSDCISVFILTAVNSDNIKSHILDEDEDIQFSKSRHFEFIDELSRAGAHVRASSSAHAKFIIADGTSSFLMTANLTDPSLIKNENGCDPNDESGVFIQKNADKIALEKLFDCVFLYGTEFKKFVNMGGNTQLIHRGEIDIMATDIPPESPNTVWTYENYGSHIYNNIVGFITSATQSINMSTYCVKELNNLSEFIHAIESIIKKGNTTVKLFCRAMNHRDDHLAACQKLSEMGVEIYGDVYNHSKGISIDDRSGMIFTANLDGKHGLKNGFEVGYKLEDNGEIFESFNSFLKHQINIAPFKFKLSPSKTELFDFYRKLYDDKGKIYSGSLPAYLEIGYKKRTSFAQEFKDDIERYPIFYSQKTVGDKCEVKFEMKGNTYLLDQLKPGSFEVKKKLPYEERISGEKYLLFYKAINLWGYES